MQRVQYVPGAVAGGAPGHTLPDGAPDIEAVIDAEITRLPGALGAHVGGGAAVNHGAGGADVTHANTAIADHVVTQPDDHTLTLITPAGGGGAVTLNNGLAIEVVGGPFADNAATTSAHAGAAVDAHVVTNPDAHPAADIVNALVNHPAADIVAALDDHLGADPDIAAGAVVRLTDRTFTIANATLLGDLLTLNYYEVGERVLVS